MLCSITMNEVNDAIRLVWSLCQSDKTRSYPLLQTEKEVQTELMKCVTNENYSLLGFFKEEQLYGVIGFFTHEEEKYFQTTVFYITNFYNEFFKEVFSYLRQQFAGYHFYLGLAKENENCLKYLIGAGFELIESSSNMNLNLNKTADIHIKNLSNIEQVNRNNFEEYAIFHDNACGTIYWNSIHLKECLDKWIIYIYREQDSHNIIASIGLKCGKTIGEIFFLFLPAINRLNIGRMLLRQCFRYAKENKYHNIIFFVEDREKDIVQITEEEGFYCVGRYCCIGGIL